VLRSPPAVVTRLLRVVEVIAVRGGQVMRPRGADRSGFLHELVLHSSPEEMLEFIVPFIRDGVAAEEPTLVLVRPETAATVLDRVEPSPHLLLLPALGQPGRPAADVRATDTLLAGYGPGTAQVRILNQEPVVPEAHWHEWRRLEAVVNHALRRHNTWAVCVYDRRPLTDEMVEDLYATHHLTGQGSTTGATTATRTRSSSSASTRTRRRTRWSGKPRRRSWSTRRRPLPARPSPDSPARPACPARRSRTWWSPPTKR
jgi:hypothetical protein